MESVEKLLGLCACGLTLAEQFLAACRNAVAGLVGDAGKPDPARLEQHQLAVHGFAWQATYVEALRQALLWAQRLHETGTLYGCGMRHPAPRLRRVPGAAWRWHPDQPDRDGAPR